ncbi:MAG: BLUF domain-containing protein [Mucilaginibacter sp.]|nr:BLUF domain-containing protein [Mucilaginibacter sp.]
MKTIVYLSKSVFPMHENQLKDILHSSRIHNAALNLSGVLLYANGIFLQLLEGRDAVVDILYKRILADQRHTNIITLVDESIAEKKFERWWMGFAVTHSDKIKELASYLLSIVDLDAGSKSTAAALAIKDLITREDLEIEFS